MIFDPAYLLFVMIPSAIIAIWAQIKVKSAFARASQIRASSGLSGAEAAAQIMLHAGIDDVAIEQSHGFLSDHYDPRSRTLRLSPDVYGGRTLASLGVAAHEAGHALQHAQNYTPLTLRNAIVPMAGFGSNFSYVVIFIGFLMNSFSLMAAGVALFSLVVLFQLINLPCEFNASSRARRELVALGLVRPDEDRQVARVLNAAAMTYVAAVISAVLTLLYWLVQLGVLGGHREE